MLSRPLQGRVAAARRSLSSAARSYDCVVVGGGIAGVSSALQLAKRGQRVLVLEQNTLTSGSTWHAAGLLTCFKGNPLVSEMALYGREMYKEIQRDVGDIGWHNTGSLGVARSEETAQSMLGGYMQGNHQGHGHVLIEDFEKIGKIHPFIANPRGDFKVAVHTPDDGIVNPADACLALARKAKDLGAVVEEKKRVVGFGTGSCASSGLRKVTSVKTACGEEIECGQVLLAGSHWTRGLARDGLGVQLPLGYAPHQYTIFERIAGVDNSLPVIREYDHCFYCKPEVGGFMLGIFEAQPIPHVPEHVMQRSLTAHTPEDAENELFEESIDKAGDHFEAALEVLPVLADTGISQWLHGPDTHSTDHNLVMGPFLEFENAWVCGGFNSQGIQCSPAAGLNMAEWMLDGHPSTFKNHIMDHALSRVNPKVAAKDEWVTYRALESYGGTYLPHYPREQLESVRGCGLKSPLYKKLVEKGGIFGEGYGWERAMYFLESAKEEKLHASCVERPQNSWEELSPCPSEAVSVPHGHYSFKWRKSGWFAQEQREALHCRRECSLFDMSPFGKIRVTGPKSLELVNYAVTANVQQKAPKGSLVYSSFLVESSGGVKGDLTVCCTDTDDYYCVVPAADPHVFQNHVRLCAKKLNMVDGVDYSLEDVTEAKATLAVMGPKSREVMSSFSPSLSFSNEAFPFGTLQQLEEGITALRVSFAGELGWELHVDADKAEAAYDRLFAAAAEKQVQLQDAGMFSLLESLRLEKGFVHNGHDIHPKATPHECGLAFTVDMKKEGGFTGKEALMKLKQQNGSFLRKRLASFVLEDKDASPGGHYSDIIYREGQRVGFLTSVGYSHVLDRPIGLGFVDLPEEARKKPRAFLEAGSYEVEHVVGEKIVRTKARCSFQCLVDPKNERMVKGSDQLPPLEVAQ